MVVHCFKCKSTDKNLFVGYTLVTLWLHFCYKCVKCILSILPHPTKGFSPECEVLGMFVFVGGTFKGNGEIGFVAVTVTDNADEVKDKVK